MTLTATPASATTARRRSGESTATPVMGGEAWVVPFEPGGHPWLTASAPQITVVDRRQRKPT